MAPSSLKGYRVHRPVPVMRNAGTAYAERRYQLGAVLTPYRGDDNLARRPSALLRTTLERLNTYAENLSMKRFAVQPDQPLSWKS